MIDNELLGFWDDHRLYQGAMEAASLVLMADGVGWYLWSNLIAEEQGLFRWSVESRRLMIRGQRYAHFEHHSEARMLTEDRAWDESITAHFTVGPGQDAYGTTVTVLELDQEIGLSKRFALIRRELQPTDDPAGWTLRA